jgi:hypothetical protein
MLLEGRRGRGEGVERGKEGRGKKEREGGSFSNH